MPKNKMIMEDGTKDILKLQEYKIIAPVRFNIDKVWESLAAEYEIIEKMTEQGKIVILLERENN